MLIVFVDARRGVPVTGRRSKTTRHRSTPRSWLGWWPVLTGLVGMRCTSASLDAQRKKVPGGGWFFVATRRGAGPADVGLRGTPPASAGARRWCLKDVDKRQTPARPRCGAAGSRNDRRSPAQARANSAGGSARSSGARIAGARSLRAQRQEEARRRRGRARRLGTAPWPDQ